ncbi:MAG: M50 family metallopeptidase [Leptospiraceae bacterium]|nr:M50 family metallopeptidase [Leptospiraceae bacterium]
MRSSISWSRVILLIVTIVMLMFFWENPVMIPLKVFVVYLHEISHALAALMTGGDVLMISIRWNESGYIRSAGGIFPIISLAGYLGSVLWGSTMLHLAMRGRGMRAISMLVGATLLIFTLIPDSVPLPGDERLTKTVAGLFWGCTFVATAAFFPRINHFLLFFMGGLTSLYSIYDLDDFFAGKVLETDAGILAKYFLGDSALVIVVAYLIAIFVAALSIAILYRILKTALRHEAPYVDDEEELEFPEQYPGEDLPDMPPEMIRWLHQVRESRDKKNEE